MRVCRKLLRPSGRKFTLSESDAHSPLSAGTPFDGNSDKKNEYLRKYYLLNKDKKKESNRLHHALNRDKANEHVRQYRRLNSDRVKESNRLYNLEHEEKKSESNRDYNLQNNDKLKEYHRQLRNGRTSHDTQSVTRKYQLDNKDRMKEYYRSYGLLNKEKISQSTRQYEDRNRDKKQDYFSQYNLQNEDKVKESKRQYRTQNADRIKELQLENYLRNHENPEIYLPRDSTVKSWKSTDSVRDFFESIAGRLLITDYTDWYRVSREQIHALGGATLYAKFSSLGPALQHAYPELNWDLSKFSVRGGKKAGQRWLRAVVEELLAGVEILEEYQHPDLNSGHFDRHLQLDLWIPKFRIGIEYQGEHHYHSMDGAFGPNGAGSLYGDRDVSKQRQCREQGITLIAIPFWWDGERGSLAATLYRARPDVFPESTAEPIPHELSDLSLYSSIEASKLRKFRKQLTSIQNGE